MDSITDICYDLSPNKADRIKSLYIEPLERQIEKLKTENQQYKNKLAEVQPVVHGKWIETSDCLATPKHYCSRCEIFAHTHLVLSLNSTAQYRIEACLDDYCPNCGARMEVQNV